MRRLILTEESVGPDYDLYARTCLTMRTDQMRELLQASALIGARVPAGVDLREVVPEVRITLVQCGLSGTYLQVNDTTVMTAEPERLWESLVGLSTGQFEEYWERLHGPPRGCRTCGGFLYDSEGYVGESVLWCPDHGVQWEDAAGALALCR